MSVKNGQDAEEEILNAAFLSRTSDTSTTGKVDLKNADSANVLDAQSVINTLLTSKDSSDTKNTQQDNRLTALEESSPLNNFNAIEKPAAGNDSTEGYSIGSYWFNTTTEFLYICTDNTEDAAVWSNVNVNKAPSWAATTDYIENELVVEAGVLYRALTGFTSGASFDEANWEAIGAAGSGGGSLSTYYSETTADLDGDSFSYLDGGVIGAGSIITSFGGVDTTTPLDGDTSLTFTIPASGSGKYCLLNLGLEVPVPLYAQTKRQIFTFETRNTGNTGDFSLFLWDDTASATIKNSEGNTLFINPVSGTKSNRLWFETDGTESLRWGVMINTDNTGEVLSIVNLKIDGSPDKEISVFASSDWEDYTPTSAWTNMTYSGKWRRLGSSMEIFASAIATGTPAGGTFTIDIPNGLEIDTGKINTASSASDMFGVAHILDSGVAHKRSGDVVYNNTTSVMILSGDGSSGSNNSFLTPTGTFTFGTGDAVWAKFSVPIKGWSDKEPNVMVSGTNAELLSVIAEPIGASQAITAGNPVVYGTVLKDSTGAYDNTTGEVTVPRTRDYLITVNAAKTTGAGTWDIYVNGTQEKAILSIPSTGTISGAIKLPLQVNDVITLRPDTGGNLASVKNNTFTVQELPNYEDLILMYLDESNISLKYSRGTTQSIPNSVLTTLIFNTKVHNLGTESLFNTSTGVYTCQASGGYSVSARVSFANNGTGDRYMYLMKNSTNYIDLLDFRKASTSDRINGSTDIYCTRGETLEIAVVQSSGGSLGLVTNSQENSFSIHRIR